MRIKRIVRLGKIRVF